MIDILLKISIAWLFCLILIFLLKCGVNKIVKKKNTIHIKYISSLLNVILIFLCIYYCFSLFDQTKEFSKTILQSSALLLAVVTFAAQQALGNVISGFTISFTKPYDVNDKIKVLQGNSVIAEGLVTDITIRHTIIKTFDGQSCIIPNNIMDNSVIMNANFTENIGNFLEVEVRFDQDIDKAINIMEKLVSSHEYTLNTVENTKVSVSRFTQNGVMLKTTVWTTNLDNNFSACTELRLKILQEFRKYGIVIPYTMVTVEERKG